MNFCRIPAVQRVPVPPYCRCRSTWSTRSRKYSNSSRSTDVPDYTRFCTNTRAYTHTILLLYTHYSL